VKRSLSSRIFATTLVTSLLFACCLVASQEAQAPRPRVGLVLSGGGARGLAHIGVLKELERMRIPVDCVAGTSMGGIVGGVFASGMPVDEIERLARQIDWAVAFQDRPDRSAMRARRKKDEDGHFARPEFGVKSGEIIAPAGVIFGQNLSEILADFSKRAIGVNDFDRLPIPFRAIATDIATGQPVVLDRGQLPIVLRATMSVPAVMAPVEIDDRLLIDGGLVDNLPVDTARRMCGDVIIAVNLGTPLLPRKKVGSAVSVGLQMVNILTEQNVRSSLKQLRPTDVLGSPGLDDLDFSNFDRADEFVAAGEAAVRAVAPQLERLAVSSEEYAEWKSRHDRPDPGDVRVDEVRIAALKWVNPEALDAEIAAAKTEPTINALAVHAKRLYETGDYERVQLSLSEENGKRVAHLVPTEKSWGPDYLRLGLSMSAQTGESTSFNAVVGHTQTWLNSYGGRWQNLLQLGEQSALFSEFQQPLAPGSPFFVAARLLGSYAQEPIYVGENQLARFSRTKAITSLEGGTTLGRHGEIRLGAQYGEEKYDTEISPFDGSTGWSDIPALIGRVDIDAMDKAHFPTGGYRVVIDYHDVNLAMGAERPYRRGVIDATMVGTLKKNTLSLQLMAGELEYESGPEAIVFDLIPMGGFQRLSAYPVNRFRVDAVEFGRLGYQRNVPPQLGFSLGGIVSQMYFGGTLEAAKIRQSYDPLTSNGTYYSTSLYVGADTILGPSALSFGFAENGQRAVWFSIGVPWTLQ